MRLITFLRVQPRIAVLYKTLEVSMDDLFHFGIVFFILTAFSSFVSMWSFGDEKEEFRDLRKSLYTQFRMLIGDFPFDDANSITPEYFIFLLVYGVIVFFILLNFFLAISGCTSILLATQITGMSGQWCRNSACSLRTVQAGFVQQVGPISHSGSRIFEFVSRKCESEWHKHEQQIDKLQ